MRGRKYFTVLFTSLIFLFALATATMPVKAVPWVKVYVDMPDGYIPGVPAGTVIRVNLIIEVSGIIDDSSGGIVGWGMDVQVDPDVLTPRRARGAAMGYFLWEFADWYWYDYPTLLGGTIDATTGYWDEISEQIMPTPPGGAGEGYTLYKLVTLEFISNSETAYSLIDLVNVEYYTADRVWHAVDEVVDGHYNVPPVPEFPLGVGLMIMLAPAIPIVYLWRLRKKVTKQ
ncbi:MAG: hypothetical protein ACE5I5_20505 [Candidatus Heimdallarchaeota archaeon]